MADYRIDYVTKPHRDNREHITSVGGPMPNERWPLEGHKSRPPHMRILHTGDLHLGRQFSGIPLEEDHQAVLDQMVQAVHDHEPHVLVIAGDVYDRTSPPHSAIRQFNSFLTRVARETFAAVAIIGGNHDSAALIGSMSIFSDAGRALIRGPLTPDERPLLISDAHGQVAISALPFAGEYAARECFQGAAISTPEDVLRSQVEAARRFVPEGTRWIIVAHAFVAGGSISEAERPVTRVGGIETVSPRVFDGAHYVALGHLHRPQSAGAPHIRYSGAPLAFGFDEVGDAKSMTLVDLDANGSVSVKTVPFMPLRGVRTVRGRMADLRLSEPSSDFIKVVLTDDVLLIDPMKQLREVFPNICLLGYARDERNRSTGEFHRPDQGRINDPAQVIGYFAEFVRGERLNEVESGLVASGLSGLNVEEIAA
jgi:DNA repair protein SbcD/Mre11